jgi:hypothetical protein
MKNNIPVESALWMFSLRHFSKSSTLPQTCHPPLRQRKRSMHCVKTKHSTRVNSAELYSVKWSLSYVRRQKTKRVILEGCALPQCHPSTQPELLWDAQKKALAAHMEIQEADELPTEINSHEPLHRSPRNIYEVMPPGLNGWEKEFAELLDRDPHKIVNWWHRNPADKPWSVNVLMQNGKGFYPDFVIGIEGRKTENGALWRIQRNASRPAKKLQKYRQNTKHTDVS